MGEIDAMRSVDDSLSSLEKDAQRRVLSWAWSKFIGADSGEAAPDIQDVKSSGKKVGKKKVTNKGAAPASGKKTVISMDKSLNLNPSGKASAEDFVAAKKPSNVQEKCVVACFYLRDMISVAQVNVSGVYTFFKHVGWPLPKDLKNALQKAGSSGWLDTADSEHILITSTGENLVEHKLPKSKD